jgi:lipopolysaccharide heptosyltransferase I
MKVLIVKTSSMGDLIHTFPALTDACKADSNIQFDWVVEENFAQIPAFHPAVKNVFTVAMRRWRRDFSRSSVAQEISTAVRKIRQHEYDFVIDAQGLYKSAIITRLCRGVRCGVQMRTCREPLAALAYQRTVPVPKANELHAIDRQRILLSEILDYNIDGVQLDYGLHKDEFSDPGYVQPYLVFLHGTSRRAKLWDPLEWVRLAEIAQQAGLTIYLPWGNQDERQCAEAIAAQTANSIVLPPLQLREVANLLAQAVAVVGVDTGLAHLAAALKVPAVTLYIDTYPHLTGSCGYKQTCLTEKQNTKDILPTNGLEAFFHRRLTAATVWDYLQTKFD